jgi:hypothetical protein
MAAVDFSRFASALTDLGVPGEVLLRITSGTAAGVGE